MLDQWPESRSSGSPSSTSPTSTRANASGRRCQGCRRRDDTGSSRCSMPTIPTSEMAGSCFNSCPRAGERQQRDPRRLPRRRRCPSRRRDRSDRRHHGSIAGVLRAGRPRPTRMGGDARPVRQRVLHHPLAARLIGRGSGAWRPTVAARLSSCSPRDGRGGCRRCGSCRRLLGCGVGLRGRQVPGVQRRLHDPRSARPRRHTDRGASVGALRSRSGRGSISISWSTALPSSRPRSTGWWGSVRRAWSGTTPAMLTSWCWPTQKATASASSTPATADDFGSGRCRGRSLSL